MSEVIEMKLNPTKKSGTTEAEASQISPALIGPSASPMKMAITSMQGYLGEVGNFTKYDPQEAWLPITESRCGNAYYAAFHTLCSGIGFQAALLPLALIVLGWTWGIICLSVGFVWQLYTLWLLIQLHESDSGMRYSRYLRLSIAAFGNSIFFFVEILVCWSIVLDSLNLIYKKLESFWS